MTALTAIFGVVLISIVLLDTFETIVLPRRVTRKYRLTRLFYRGTWIPWAAWARNMPTKRRERFLSFYGPLSLIVLLSLWGLLLVVGFGCLHFATGSFEGGSTVFRQFLMDVYYSGTTMFTLGLGDIAPKNAAARVLTVIQAFLGFGFLAVVIGYFPVLYQAFSRREVEISLLDARAGSPPSATELLRRHSDDYGHEAVTKLLQDWERWSAEMLESHLSYPVLCFFRSQHDNESWLSAVATILDASALVLVGVDGACRRQAQMTFAIARHALVDLSQVLGRSPIQSAIDRLSPDDLARMRSVLADAGLQLPADGEADRRLVELRSLYEPYLFALSDLLLMPLPDWIREGRPDNWQTSAWGRISGTSRTGAVQEKHF